MSTKINKEVLNDYNIVDIDTFFKSKKNTMTITIKEYNKKSRMKNYKKYYFEAKGGKNGIRKTNKNI